MLGAIFIDDTAFDLVADPDDFHLVAHQQVFAASAEPALSKQAVVLHQLLEAKGLRGAAAPRDLPFALAPEAQIAVYFAPNTDRGFLDAILAAVHHKTNAPSMVA